MKTMLYKDNDTGLIHTFSELKDLYAEHNNSDLPIDDDTMYLIIIENLVQNNGNLVRLDDEILKWCNDFAEYNEADRYLTAEERELSVKTIYEWIAGKEAFTQELRKCIEPGNELLERLDNLLRN